MTQPRTAIWKNPLRGTPRKRPPLVLWAMALCGLVACFAAAVPDAEKTTPSLQKGPETVKLPVPANKSETSLEAALSTRRSIRAYADEPLGLANLSQLLWAAQGITDPHGFRTAPSAGALYPLEVHAVVGNVTGLAPGIYKYRPQGHEIEKMADGDKRSALAEAALGQSCVRTAPVSFVFSAVIERTRAKYGERAERYVWIEAGHAAQNVLLQAVSLNLGAVPVGAFRDDRVKAVLSLGEGEEVLYIVAVGKPKTPQRGR